MDSCSTVFGPESLYVIHRINFYFRLYFVFSVELEISVAISFENHEKEDFSL